MSCDYISGLHTFWALLIFAFAAPPTHSHTQEEVVRALHDRWRVEANRRLGLQAKLLSLRGAVRVYCRVSHLVPLPVHVIPAVRVLDPRTVELLAGGGSHSLEPGQNMGAFATPAGLGARRFVLDGVVEGGAHSRPGGTAKVDQAAPSEVSLARSLADLIEPILDGINACVVAYGESGSGKSDALFGGAGGGVGIIALLCRDLFAALAVCDAAASAASIVSASACELVGDEMHDLLKPDGDAPRHSLLAHASDGLWVHLRAAEDADRVVGIVCARRRRHSLRLASHGRAVRDFLETLACLFFFFLARSHHINPSPPPPRALQPPLAAEVALRCLH